MSSGRATKGQRDTSSLVFCASCDSVVLGDHAIAYSSGFVLCTRCSTHNKKKKRKRREKPQEDDKSVPQQIASYWLEEAFRAAPTTAFARLLEKCSDHAGILAAAAAETRAPKRSQKK